MTDTTDAQGPEPGESPRRDDDDRLLEAVRETAIALNPSQAGQIQVTMDSRLDRDLGIDSLGRVALLSRVEQAFDVTLPDEALAASETPRDLMQAVYAAHGGPPAVRRVVEVTLPSREAGADVPAQADNLVDVLDWHVSTHGDRAHIRFYSDEDEGEVITYAQLRDESERMAGGLRALGLERGQAVILMLATGRDYFTSFMGVLMAGGTPVPIYPPTRPSQIEDHLIRHQAIIDNCRAVIMITMPEAVAIAQLMRIQTRTLRRVVTAQAVRDGSPGAYRDPNIGSGDTAFIQYTSGSTGVPKGVVLTHANLLANIRAMQRVTGVTAKDVFVSWLPLYHDMGLIGAWFGSLYTGAHLVSMSPIAFLARPARWLWAIHRFRATLSAAPNFAYELCLKRIDDADLDGLDLSSWRMALNGAEAVSPDTLRGFIDRFAKYGFAAEAAMPVYGLAECSVGLSFPPLQRGPRVEHIRRLDFMERGEAVPADPDDATALRFVGCGMPLPGHQIRIVDGAGRELPERQEGRLQFQGPSTTAGYLRAPDKNQALFDGPWLNAGDMAYMAGGEVFLTGRSKDIIIRAGRNLYPAEMEDEVGRLDGIRDGRVAVFGSTSEVSGTERLVVMAETRETKPEALIRLRADINGIIADLAGSPADDVVLAPPGTVLKTSSGKIRRTACRDLYERGDIGKGGRAVWLQLARVGLLAIGPALREGMQTAGRVLYAGWCWTMAALLAPILWGAVVMLPRERLRWRAIRLLLGAAAMLVAMRIRIKGHDLLPDAGEPVIYVANHQSYLDALVLAAVLGRPVSFVAKAELRANALIRLALDRLGVHWVERFETTKSIADARALAQRAKDGRSILIFAEGTLTRMPGLLPFRMGAFETAVAADLPVVPLVIHGTRSVLRDQSWFPRRGTMTITIGEPIMAPVDEEDHFSRALALRDETRAWMLRHCAEPDLGHERPPVLSGDRQP